MSLRLLPLLLWPILWWGFSEAAYCAAREQLAPPPVPLSIDLSHVSEDAIAQTVRHLQAIVRASEARAENLAVNLEAEHASVVAAQNETLSLQATVDAQTVQIASLKPWRGKCIRILLLLSAIAAGIAFRALAIVPILWARIAAALAAGALIYGILYRFF